MRILIFEWGTGTLTHRDMLDTFNEMNIEADVVSYQFRDCNKDDFFLKRFSRFLEDREYDFVYSTNYFPLVAVACNRKNIKYISWSYDAPLDVPNIEDTLGLPCNYVFLYDSVQAQEYMNKGFTNIYHLPLAVNTKRLKNIHLTASEKEYFSSDVSFVGNIYNSSLPEIESVLNEYYKGYIEAVKKAQSQIYGYYLIDDVITSELIEGMNAYIGKDVLSKESLSYAIGAQITREDRLLGLKLLSNHFDVKLYSSCTNELLDKVRYMGTVRYMDEMPKVFKASKINLNMSLRCIKSGIPLRVLDVLGAGGFLITNYQPEIDQCFVNGEELVMYESIEDMYQKVDYYLKHEDERLEIAKRGCERVEKYFGYRDRVEKMLEAAGLCI